MLNAAYLGVRFKKRRDPVHLKSFIIILSIFIIPVADAANSETITVSGSIDTSVNALNKEGFICASGEAKPFLLAAMPKFLASRLGTTGQLKAKNNGKYRIALVLDENSKLVGYKVGPNTEEGSTVVQSVLSVEQFPILPSYASCVAGKAFMYELTLEQ